MTTRILCYHEIDQAQATVLARQLDSVARWGRIEPLSAQALRQPAATLSLTFDDGDATLGEVVQPLLDARGLKATLYVVTDYVRRGQYHNGREMRRAVNWEQLGRWLEAGHQIGSHTHTHANLPRCPRQQIVDELGTSRELLRSRLGLRVQHFAYPWGQYDARVVGIVAAFGGFATAASIDRGGNDARTSALTLRRDLADPSMGVAGLQARLCLGSCNGLYRAIRVLRRRPVAKMPEVVFPAAAPNAVAPPLSSSR